MTLTIWTDYPTHFLTVRPGIINNVLIIVQGDAEGINDVSTFMLFSKMIISPTCLVDFISFPRFMQILSQKLPFSRDLSRIKGIEFPFHGSCRFWARNFHFLVTFPGSRSTNYRTQDESLIIVKKIHKLGFTRYLNSLLLNTRPFS